MKTSLVVCPQTEAVQVLLECLGANFLIDQEDHLERGVERCKKQCYDYAFYDVEVLLAGLEHPIQSISSRLDVFQSIFAATDAIILSPHERVADALELVNAGAAGYLTYPIDCPEVNFLFNAIEKRRQDQLELAYLRKQLWRNDPEGTAETYNETMKELLCQARSVAATKTTVLLMGESGTGKGVLARLIQRHSNRADKPFVEVHCGAMPDTLLESELFGYEKGAFTGADRRKLGRFELAQGGTIFLDEISTVTSGLQVKLLHVLQERTFFRVGGETPVEVDVRIIAASNADLKRMVEDEVFREDLYYRLNIFPLKIPPLRERSEDIAHLVHTILEKLNSTHLKGIHEVHPLALEALQQYPWPGNIRELENVLERAYILESTSTLMPVSFSAELFAFHPVAQGDLLAEELSLMEARQRGTALLEEEYLTKLLKTHKGHIKDSAAVAGITPRQLYKLIRKYGIRFAAFRDQK